MKKILITGATGFIGEYIVERLSKSGFEIFGISRNCKNVVKKNVCYLSVDISDKSELENAFKKIGQCDYIIHLASDINMSASENTMKTNVLGTYYLLDLALEYKAKLFINFSSAPVIGVPESLPINENSAVKPQTIYHLTKYISELLVENKCKNEMQYLNYRIVSPIGINMPKNKFLSVILKQCHDNEIIDIYGNGERIQSYIDVRDIAKAVECGINSKKSGTYFIAANQEISNKNLAILCKKLCDSKSEIRFNEKKDVEEKVAWIFDNSKARNELKFKPDFDIDDTIRWIINGWR